MDLIFDGRVGQLPARDSLEFAVLEACEDRRCWPRLKHWIEPGDFEWTIARLRELGWGFEWVTRQ